MNQRAMYWVALAVCMGTINAQAQTAAPAATTSTQTVSPAPASTADAAQAITIKEEVASKESPWGAQVLLETHQVGFDLSQSVSVNQENYFYVSYKHNDHLKSTIRLNFNHELFKSENGSEVENLNPFKQGNHLYQITNSSLFDIPSLGVKGDGYLRVYFPTSKKALDEDTVVRLRPLVEATKEVGPVALTLGDFADLYARRKVTMLGKPLNVMENYVFFTASMEFLKDWNVYTTNYYINNIAPSDISVGVNGYFQQQYAMEIGLSYSVLKNLKLVVYAASTAEDLEVADSIWSSTTPGITNEAFLDVIATF